MPAVPFTTSAVIRRVSVPVCDPPADDELAGEGSDASHSPALHHVQGTLALSMPPCPLTGHTPVRRAEPRPLSTLAPPSGDEEAADNATADGSVDAGPRVALIVRGLLEVLAGWRQPGQLRGCLTPTLLFDLDQRVPRRPVGRPARVVRLRTSAPHPQVREVTALIAQPLAHGRQRLRALAVRLELRTGRWVVSRLEVG